MNLRIPRIIKGLNYLGFFGITAILLIALIIQLHDHELPCPLCLLQRLGILAIGFGLWMNIKYGSKPFHYSLSILSALFTSFIAMRQVILHINDPLGTGYGMAFLGLHMYTWVFILCCFAIIALIILMSLFILS